MERPTPAYHGLSATAACAGAVAGARNNPAITTITSPPTSHTVSQFWVRLPARMPTMFTPVRAAHKMVVAAGVGIGRRKLGVAKGSDHRHDPACNPHGDHDPFGPGVDGDEGRRLENSGADDEADDDPDGVAEREGLHGPGGRMLRGIVGRRHL